MLELAYPWMLLALPLPLLVYWLAPPHIAASQAVRVPFFARLVAAGDNQPARRADTAQRLWLQRIALVLAWLCIVLAMARPQYLGEPQVQEKSARDLMIVVDLSGSMDAQDFQLPDGSAVSRTTAVKQVLRRFVQARQHDRLGMIVFADAAFLQAPFTEDHDTWLALLEELETGMAGQRTMLGDAIGLAIRLFESAAEPGDEGQTQTADLGSRQRVMIVLTDGNDTGSKVPPVEAAKVAANKDIIIYTIAIGDPETVGEEALDVETLQRMASMAGGQYYQALDLAQLGQVTQDIGKLEPDIYESLSFQPTTDLHYVLVIPLLAFYALLHSVMVIRRMRQYRRVQAGQALEEGASGA